jgi:hypothetical protein
VTDHDAVLTRAIIDRIRDAIAQLPENTILTSGEAFVLAQDTVRKDAAERGLELSHGQLDSYIRKTCLPAFSESRRLIAEQLRGMTLQDAIKVITEGVRRLTATGELEIVPKPTKAFSGYCDPHDPWNLICNAIKVEKAVSERDADLVADEDIRLIAEIRKAHQLLHFVVAKEVLIEDFDGVPFDGSTRAPEWLSQMRLAQDNSPA